MLLDFANAICEYLNAHDYVTNKPAPHLGLGCEAYHDVLTSDGCILLANLWYHPDCMAVERIQEHLFQLDKIGYSTPCFTRLEYADPTLFEQILGMVREQLRAKLARSCK